MSRRFGLPTAALLAGVAAVLAAPACGDPEETDLRLLESDVAGVDGASCASDGDCAPPTPYCDTATHVCVECLTAANCGDEICDPVTHVCRECRSSGDCSGSHPYCAAGQCVECLEPGNCPDPGETCDDVQYKCVALCAQDVDCTDRNRVLCDAPREICVECLADTDCADDKPRCVADECAECLSDGDCADPEPYCRDDRSECKECRVDEHCAAGLWCDNYACKE